MSKIQTIVKNPVNLKLYVKSKWYTNTSILLVDESGVPREYILDKFKLIDTIQFEWYDRTCEVFYKSLCEDDTKPFVEVIVTF